MVRAFALVSLLALVGCNKDGPTQLEIVDSPVPEPVGDILSFNAPGGEVRIGGTLAEAQEAFPPPTSAEVFERSMAFAKLRKNGWAWAAGTGLGFEVALDDGKIFAITFSSLEGPPLEDALNSEARALGEPTKDAESENAAMYVWEKGESARFFILFKNDKFIMGPGTMTVIGPKEALKSLNYDYDDPGAYIKAVDDSVGATGK